MSLRKYLLSTNGLPEAVRDVGPENSAHENVLSNNQGNRERHFGTREWNFFRWPARNSTPPITKGVGEANPNVQSRRRSRPMLPSIRLRRIAANHDRFLPFSITARACDNPRQSTTPQTNQPASTGSEDRVVEHKGSVRRGVVFFRQGRARSVA